MRKGVGLRADADSSSGANLLARGSVTPILRLLLRDLLVLLVLTVTPIVGISWWGYANAMDDTAHAKAHESLRRMADALHEQIVRQQRSANAAARLCAANGPEGCRGDVMHGALVSIAPAQSSFRSLGIALADGWVLDVAPQGQGLMTESCRLKGAQSYCRATTWALDGALIERKAEVADDREDVRQRPWYAAALARKDGRWGAPYIQRADGARLNRFRMTYATKVPAQNSDGLAGAVAESAMSLDDLLSGIRALQPSAASITLITDEHRQPILLPNVPDFQGIEASPAGSAIGAAYLPLADRIVDAASREDRIEIDGEDYYLASLRFDREPGIDWVISMGVPASELLGGPRRVALTMIAFAALAVLVVILRAIVLARRFSAPLRALTAATQRIADGDAIALPPTDIEEVRELGDRFAIASAATREKAQLEADLRHAQRVATIGTLAGGIVHDINNQLTALLGALELAARDGEENHELELARTAAASCADLTRGLLAFSRGGSAIRKKPLDVNDMVKRSVQLLGGTLRRSKIDLVLELDSTCGATLGDRVLLEQVVMNLALNARDAMPSGGRLTLSTARRSPGEIILAVTDTGIGLSAEVRAKMFEAFFTTKDDGKGTGLGLSIVHGIVHAHGGRIEVESAAGAGSTFTLVLPSHRDAATARAETG